MKKSKTVRNLGAGKPQHIVTYGTSLTADGAWVDQLRTFLNRRYPGLATVTNSGRCGIWSKWGVDNLEKQVIKKEPHAVFVEFAINDADLHFKCSAELARANLENMVDRVLAANPDCEIILMTTNPTTAGSPRPRLSEYYQVYRDVARERQLLLIDLEPNWRKVLETDEQAFERFVPDGVHPSESGCRKVITPAILAALDLQVG
jgi:acyl-CoA thioesterase-1